MINQKLFEELLKKKGIQVPEGAVLTRRDDPGPYQLSFTQRRIWFLQQFDTGSAAYNDPTALRIKGPLNIPVLEQTFNEIIRRHQVLRMTFPAHNGHPKKRIQDLRIHLDDLTNRLAVNMGRHLRFKQERMQWNFQKLTIYSPANRCKLLKDQLNTTSSNLLNYYNKYIQHKRNVLREASGALDLLNPMAILSRGYSITRTIPEKNVVRDARTVSKEQPLEILLGKGTLNVKVK